MRGAVLSSILRITRPSFITPRVACYGAYASRRYSNDASIPFPSAKNTNSSRDDVAPRPILTPEISYTYHIYVKATRNNTVMTLAGPNAKKEDKWGPLLSTSGGRVGFKNVQRSGYEAGYQCAIQVFQKVAQERERLSAAPMRIFLFFNGFGQGREAVFRALMANEGAEVRGMVARVTDRTPIKIGGTRSKKKRIL